MLGQKYFYRKDIETRKMPKSKKKKKKKKTKAKKTKVYNLTKLSNS